MPTTEPLGEEPSDEHNARATVDSGAEVADELLSWQKLDQARQDRELANNALQAVKAAFERVSRGEYGPNEVLKPLAEEFDADLALAIARLLGDVRDVLFEDPQEMWTGRETRVRYAVEFVPQSTIRELGKTLERIMVRTLEKEFPERREVTDLLPELVKSLHRPLENMQAARSGTIAGQGGVRVSIPRAVSTSEQTVRNRWASQLKDIEENFRQRIRLASVVERAEEAANDTSRARDAARLAAGATGSTMLGSHFAQVARREARLASQWTAFTIAAIVAVVGLGSLFIRQGSQAAWTESLPHLVVVLPIIGLASYTARIARHHRMHGRWSDTAAVQLASIPAFAEQLSTEGREQLILGVGAHVFAAPVVGSDDVRSEHISAIPPDLIDALKALGDRLPKDPR